MVLASLTLNNDYWETIHLQDDDIEAIYHHLLEIETPLTVKELVGVLVENRLEREQVAAEKKRSEGGKPYFPKDLFDVGEKVVFPHLDWKTGVVSNVRDARDYSESGYKVIEVDFDKGEKREFASGLENHKLNILPTVDENDPLLSPHAVVETFGDGIGEKIKEVLESNDDFVYIAGRWFPRALLVEVNVGNLNLAEAVLDMAKGGPLATSDILTQVDLPDGVNKKLAEFSLDLALQEDKRFDEVGSAGQVAWFLKRMEPDDVQRTPLFLRYNPIEFSTDELSDQMKALEQRLDDELTPRGVVRPAPGPRPPRTA